MAPRPTAMMNDTNSDIDDIAARREDRRTHPSHECPDAPSIDADILILIDELTRARAHVQLLMENEGDLRASAEIWCRLYEASVGRANAAEAAANQARETLPDVVKQLYAALDRVAALTDALGSVVRECTVCAQNPCDAAAVSRITTEVCRRCTRALEALQRHVG
jgi:hypothetical protein